MPRQRATANPSLNLPKDWALLCTIAYKQQISLGALGFYASPFGGAYRWRTHEEIDDLSKAAANEHRGEIFNYFAYGAACAEVELDVLSGNFSIRRADVLMDVGESLNVAVDIGQVCVLALLCVCADTELIFILPFIYCITDMKSHHRATVSGVTDDTCMIYL